MKYEELFVTREGIDAEDFIVATYFVECASKNALLKAAALAVEQTTGTWLPVPEETSEVREKHVGKVLGVYEIPDYEIGLPKDTEERRFILRIAFPEVNINAQIPLLLSTVIGNISMSGKLKLIDLDFPNKFIKRFEGPKFGIDGIRRLLNVPQRPLLNNMIKPCTGISPEVGAKLFYEAAVGGTDVVKDDELIADVSFSRTEDRVRQFMAAEKRAYEETGEHTLYTVNITDAPHKIVANAKRAIELGANALMINYLTVGISSLQGLVEDPDINVPVLAHLDFAGVMYESPVSGMSSHLVLGKLPRIAGADIVVFPSPYGKFEFMREKYLKIALSLRMDMGHIGKTWPAPGGGIYPGMLPVLFEDLGNDFIVAAGGAIHGHPMGAPAGARALRQGIDAMMQGRALEDAAKEYPELKAAIEAWGIYGKSDKELYELK